MADERRAGRRPHRPP